MTSPEDSPCRGIYHIHSDFSYDGNNRLEEIAHWSKKNGLAFVLLTEHDLGFSQEKFEEYWRQCEHHSGEVLLVPGIEYEVIQQGAIIHIGAIGVPQLLERSVIEGGLSSLVEAIHRFGGLAILHHPNNIKKVLTQQQLEVFDFIEVWNTKFDCGFAPNTQFLHWLKGMDNQGPYLVSADIHQVNHFNKRSIAFIDLEASPQALQQATIMDCMKKMRYRCRTGRWTLRPDGTCQDHNMAFRLLAAVCLLKKCLFRLGKSSVPRRHRKAVYKFINRSWLR